MEAFIVSYGVIVVAVVLGLVLAAPLYFILRYFNAWFFRINELLKNQKTIIEQNEKTNELLERLANARSTSTPSNPVDNSRFMPK